MSDLIHDLETAERAAKAILNRFYDGSSGLNDLTEAIALCHAKAALSAVHFNELLAAAHDLWASTTDKESAPARALRAVLSKIDAETKDAG